MTDTTPRNNVLHFPEPIKSGAAKAEALRCMDEHLALMGANQEVLLNSRELLVIGRYLRDLYADDVGDPVPLAVAVFSFNVLVSSLANPIAIARSALGIIEATIGIDSNAHTE